MPIDLNEPIKETDSPKVKCMKRAHQAEQAGDDMLIGCFLLFFIMLLIWTCSDKEKEVKMTSADAIDQEILNDLRNAKKVEDTGRFESITKTIIKASKMLKEKKAGNPNFPYLVSEDVYKFLQEAEKKDSKA